MKIIFLHIMLILSNSLLSAQLLTIPKDYYYYQVTVEVVRVIDGDTFVLSDSTHVRLLGVDTPELNKKSIEDTLFADSAAAFLRNLIDKKSIKLTFDLSPFIKGGNTKGVFYDIYGRLLAYAWLTDSQGKDSLFIQAELLKAGLARIRYYPERMKYYYIFQNLKRTARRKRLGIWGIK